MEHVGAPGAPVMTAAIITLITHIYDLTIGRDAAGVLTLHKKIMRQRLKAARSMARLVSGGG
ncbi:MAG: hypothetical protein ACJ8CR_10460 [Roseiflexaceae bacterium]